MSNQLTTTNLPKHLAKFAGNTALATINQSASGGISGGGWPRISIRASRFRLVKPDGEETPVPQLHLDVILVGSNPGISKLYYGAGYDPNAEGSAPDCFSDNGVAPSSRATKPQCGTCAACPHNAWGSKITPAGAKIKACADMKKVAVLIADNPNGPVFELRVPAASLTNLGQYIKALDKHGIPASTVVTRLQFDTAADFPKLVFAPAFDANGQMPYISEEQATAVEEVMGSDEVKQCTGENDTAAGTASLTAPAASLAQATQQPLQRLQDFAPAPVVAPAPVMVPAEEAPKRRGRKPAGSTSAASVAPAILTEPELPKFLQTGVREQVPLTPPVTNASLDDLIKKAMAT